MPAKSPYNDWMKILYYIKEQYTFPEKFELIRNEEGRIHYDNGPAYLSPTKLEWYQNGRRHGLSIDIFGTKLYWYEGICIPNRYFTNPEELTVEEVFKHPNAEVRYVGMKIIGFDTIRKSNHVKTIHQDKKIDAELFKIDKIFSEPVCIVRVKNATPNDDGTHSNYYLVVPPTMKTCAQAIAWTFYMEENEYHPSQET